MRRSNSANFISNPILTDEDKRFPTDQNELKLDVVDLYYEIQIDKKWKKLLKNVNLSFKKGEMHALMGPSGAGKSTLLDLLANRKYDGRWSGEIFVNNCPRTEDFSFLTTYVQQDDVHCANLTVEETLYFAVWTRVPSCKTKESRQKRVDELLELFGLEHIRSSTVGSALQKGISGGQMKRLSIAVELANPAIEVLFLDEPTSGLDSALALEVMTVVRQITDYSRLSVTTIHQPSPDIFQLFDKVTLLAHGRVIFSAEVENVVSYFSSPQLGYAAAFIDSNPAETIIAIASGKISTENNKTVRPPAELARLYLQSKHHLSAAERDEEARGGVVTSTPSHLLARSELSTDTLTQCAMLLRRQSLNLYRDKKQLAGEILRVVIGGVFTGVAFYGQADISSPFFDDGVVNEEVNSLNGCFYFVIYYLIVGSMLAISRVSDSQILFQRERAAHAYSALPYWLAQILHVVPLHLLATTLFVLLFYFLVGLSLRPTYFLYLLALLLLCNFLSHAAVFALTAACKDAKLSTALFPLSFACFSTLSGYGIPVEEVRPMWRWATYISYYRWVFEGLLVNEYERYDTDDSNDEYHGDVLEFYGFDNFDKLHALWICALFIAGFNALALYALLPRKSKLIKVDRAVNTSTSTSKRAAVFSPVKKQSAGDYVHLAGDGESGGEVNRVSSSGWKTLQESTDMPDDSDGDEDWIGQLGATRQDTEFFRVSSGVVRPAPGCEIVFQDLSYAIPVEGDNSAGHGQSEKVLLRKVSGRVGPGEMVALMGSSGSGKTTLLDVLAQRKTIGRLTGQLYFDGRPTVQSAAARMYVMQENQLLPALSVRETLQFAAELRLPELWPADRKLARVEKLIDLLGLQDVSAGRVGDVSERGISGGQAKRLAIGVELVNLPTLLFLDEPTTGLDDRAASEVVSMLRNLANQRRTVVCTIHQPARSAFELFDGLLVLAHGRLVYSGPVGQAVSFLAGSPFGFQFKKGTNPAEFIVAAASGGAGHVNTEELADYFETQDAGRRARESVQRAIDAIRENGQLEVEGISAGQRRPTDEEAEQEELQFTRRGNRPITSTQNQLRVLLRRSWLVHIRNFKLNFAVIFRYLLLALFYGSVYFQLDTGGESAVYSSRLAVFFTSLVLGSAGFNAVMPQMLEDRALFYRERAGRLYGSFAFWASSWLVQLPVLLLATLLYSVIVYSLVRLKNSFAAFCLFYLFLCGGTIAGMLMTFAVVAWSPTLPVAFVCYQPAMMLNDLYCGFRVYLPTLPEWQAYTLPYVSFLRYAFEGLTLNEFLDNDDLPKAHAELRNLGFNSTVTLNGCIAMLGALIAFYAALFYLGLKYCNFEQR